MLVVAIAEMFLLEWLLPCFVYILGLDDTLAACPMLRPDMLWFNDRLVGQAELAGKSVPPGFFYLESSFDEVWRWPGGFQKLDTQPPCLCSHEFLPGSEFNSVLSTGFALAAVLRLCCRSSSVTADSTSISTLTWTTTVQTSTSP